MLSGRKYPTGMTLTWFWFLEASLGACSHGTPRSPLRQPALPLPAALGWAGSRGSISKEEVTAASQPSPASRHGCSYSCKGSKCWPCCSLGCWGWPGMELGDRFYRSKANRNVLITQAPWWAAPWLQQAVLANACVLPWAPWAWV